MPPSAIAVERAARHLLLAAAEQELEHRRRRELRRAAPPTPLRVEALAEVALRGLEQRSSTARREARVRAGPDVLGEAAARRADLVAPVAPGLATPSRTCLNDGRPCRGSGGK